MGSIIRGVLNGSAGAAGTPWCLVLHLMPWREIGSPLADLELRIEIPVAEEQIPELMGPLAGGVAVEVDIGSLVPRPDWQDFFATGRLPVRVIEADEDLRQRRAKLDEPVVIQDPALGPLTLDRRFKAFMSKPSQAHDFSVMISQSGVGEDRARDLRDIDDARSKIVDVECRLADIKSAIAAEKLDLYNDGWREEDDPEIDAEEFVARLKLSSIHVQGDTRTTAYFDDGGLFLGHCFEVRLDGSGALQEICLAG